MGSKYLNRIYEGKWKVENYFNEHYILVNTYNGQTLTIHHNTMKKLDDKKTTVSKIIITHMKMQHLYRKGFNRKYQK